MRIACLGWGSLIWDPRGLRIVQGEPTWHADGPWLPVEFARQSQRDRMTLVLTPGVPEVQVLWAWMIDSDIEAARSSLAAREGSNAIAIWPSSRNWPFSDVVAAWARRKGIEAVVWTAIGTRFNGKDGIVPTCEQVMAYLQDLVARQQAANAEEYIRRAPAQVRTPYRERIENDLGWRPAHSPIGKP